MVVHLGSLRVTEPLVEAAERASELGAIVSMNPGGINATRGYKALKGILDHVDVLVVSRRKFDKMFGLADIEKNAKICFENTGVKLPGRDAWPPGKQVLLRRHLGRDRTNLRRARGEHHGRGRCVLRGLHGQAAQ